MNKVKLESSETLPFEQIADLIAGHHTPAWLSDHSDDGLTAFRSIEPWKNFCRAKRR